MTKSNRLYKIFMTTMIVIIAGMLLATGIIAIQKSMKLNVSMSMLPTANIEILVGGAESETLLFRNFDKDTNNKVYVDTSKATLSGNTFSLKDSFVNTYGSEFTIIVKNYSNFPIKVGLSSTATGSPATITPASQSLAACSSYTSPTSAEFSVTIEAVMTQTTNLTIVISEVSIATLKTGDDVNTAIGTDSTSVVFDYWTAEYEAIVGNWSSGTAIDVDDAGKIKLFSVDTARYILSESEIYANENCFQMFWGCESITNIIFDNFNTSNVTRLQAVFYDCTGLTVLDLSGWDTSNVVYMGFQNGGLGVFAGCINLRTIYVSDLWSNESVSNGTYMFQNCTSLVGGNGTTYDSNNVTSDYARIDAPGTPGYFTHIDFKDAPTLTLNFEEVDYTGVETAMESYGVVEQPLHYTVVITNDENFNVYYGGDSLAQAMWQATDTDEYSYSKTGDVYLGYEVSEDVAEQFYMEFGV